MNTDYIAKFKHTFVYQGKQYGFLKRLLYRIENGNLTYIESQGNSYRLGKDLVSYSSIEKIMQDKRIEVDLEPMQWYIQCQVLNGFRV